MKLKCIEIQNFRRLRAAKINLEPAAFILGPNNFGKSSILRAIEVLTSLGDTVDAADFREDENGDRAAELVICGTFGPIDALTAASRGFKGRVINDEFCYQKKWTLGTAKPTIEVKEYPYILKDAFSACKNANDLVAAGIASDTVKEILEVDDLNAKLPKNWERMFPEALEFDTTVEPVWVANPGGIPQNVTSKLPRVIRIPATTDQKNIDSSEKKIHSWRMPVSAFRGHPWPICAHIGNSSQAR